MEKVTKVDEEKLIIEQTYERVIKKEELLTEKKMVEKDLEIVQGRLTKLNELLGNFK